MLALRSGVNDFAAAEDALARLTNNSRVCEPLSAAVVFGRAIGEQVCSNNGARPGASTSGAS